MKKGVVIDSLSIPSKEGSNYSIYLPKSFDLSKTWPILFGFDSTGNANAITTLFSKAAEELNYVVVVADFPEKSNINDKSDYVPLIMEHIFSLLPIHNRRIYVTGIGEDATLNSLLPIIYKEFNGVIAINNTYYYNESVKVRKDFSYIGVVHDKNFRYQYFLNTKKYLKRKSVPTDIYVYDKNEALPLQSLMKKALLSFTLQDMLKGKILTDSTWVKQAYEKDLREVELLEKKKAYLHAYDELTRIRNKYHLFFETDFLKEEQKRIKKLSVYKKEKRLRSKYHNREGFLRETLFLSLEEDVEFSQYENLGWWQYRMNELDTLIVSNEKYATNMAFRIKGYLKNLIKEYKKEDKTKEEQVLDQKIFLNVLSTIVDKEDFESYRNVISFSAMDQDYETALFYLEKMLQHGFKDIEQLYVIEGTLALKLSKEYNELIKKYLGTSKYHSFE
ncbi:hypothetical protein [Aquimarina sp. 2201CG14-23]|uniref:hypothetical protein n=1 Tax=Aquimarina mycalae TaxID=3040073 RepID=UPI0024781634|nr:hypothetical protein [Aquimarina sp. 2201CG14-23]MDH7444496.1 hypothetical protein [Aquimarina sp. 2201CG14-23]